MWIDAIATVQPSSSNAINLHFWQTNNNWNQNECNGKMIAVFQVMPSPSFVVFNTANWWRCETTWRIHQHGDCFVAKLIHNFIFRDKRWSRNNVMMHESIFCACPVHFAQLRSRCLHHRCQWNRIENIGNDARQFKCVHNLNSNRERANYVRRRTNFQMQFTSRSVYACILPPPPPLIRSVFRRCVVVIM